MYVFKEFQDLTIGDDFMFAAVMGDTRNNLCKEFLEALLGIEIDHIECVDGQKDLTDGYYTHGIRLGIYVKDKNETVYNIELQYKKDAVEKRARSYQSNVDWYQLLEGELKDNHFIFVCTYDHFGIKEPVYERKSVLKGHPERAYLNGSHILLLNSEFSEEKAGNTDPRILDFLRLVHSYDATPKTDFAKAIKEEVSIIKKDSQKVEEYIAFTMQMEEQLRDGIDIGRTEGIAIGRAEGIAQGTTKGRAEGMADLVYAKLLPVDIGAEQSGMEADEFLGLIVSRHSDYKA